MYQKAGLAGASMATSGSLAMTGASITWIILGGFAMIAVGTALFRIAPRFGRR